MGRVGKIFLSLILSIYASRVFLRAGPPEWDDDGPIVSMTSFPARFRHAWVSVASLLLQKTLPSRIVLVLDAEEFQGKRLGRKMDRLERLGVEFLWSSGVGVGYKKLLPVMRKYPGADIITVDDDAFYRARFIDILTKLSKSSPETTICFRARRVGIDAEQGFAPYKTWRLEKTMSRGFDLLPTGVGGVLYQGSALSAWSTKAVAEVSRLAPRADDIGFWALSTFAGIHTLALGTAQHFPLVGRCWDAHTLWAENTAGGNDRAIRDLDRALGLAGELTSRRASKEHFAVDDLLAHRVRGSQVDGRRKNEK